MRRLHRFTLFTTALLTAVAVACTDAPGDGGSAASADGEAAAEARTAAGGQAGEAPDTAASDPASSALLDPNQATRDQLLALPHLDEGPVDALISGRPYADMLEVDALLADRLGPEAREELYGRLFLPLDLNAASEEEILLIPGVGDRMAHEFEEYRPYRGIEEFRREIGKYVDDQEVARLERFVRVP